MNESHTKKEPKSRRWKKLASAALLGTGLLSITLFIILRIMLSTHLANDYLSNTLSQHLDHKVTVEGIAMAGVTIYLNDITIESPQGFKNQKMVSARTVSLTPDIIGLLRGRRSLSQLTIIGLSLKAEKNSVDSWNFSALLHRLTKKKDTPSSEIFIRRFSLQDGNVQIDGHKFEKLGLTLADFSTKGTTNSRLELSGKDDAGNPLRLTAAGHLGSDPAFDITVEAPAVSLAPLQKFLSGKPPIIGLEKAQGKLSLSAVLRDRLFTIKAAGDFKQLFIHLRGSSLPISGQLDFEAQYNSLKDKAELSRANITVNNLVTVHASGTMQRCSTEGLFTLQLAPDKTDLKALSSLLPEQNRRELSLSGEMSSRGFQLTGNRSNGITSARGDLSIRKVSVTQAKQLIMTRGTANFSLRKTADEWQADGKVFTNSSKDTPLIESLSIPFTARFNPLFKPTRVTATAIRATVTGIPLRASFQYLETTAAPFTLSCSATDVPLRRLNGFLSRKLTATRITSGKGTATARLSGTSPQKFSGRVMLDIISAEGTASKSKISVKKAAILATIKKTNGIFSGNGTLKASGGDLDGKPFSGKTGFTLGSGKISLYNPLLTFATTRIQVKQLTGKLPTTGISQQKGKIPLIASFSGAEVRNGDLAAAGISGTINASYDSANTEHPVAGISDISVTSMTYRNNTLASATAHLTANGKSIVIDIKGKSLDGTLSAKITTGFFSKNGKTSFSALFLKQKLVHSENLLPKKLTPRISAGMADVQLSGTYTKKNGIDGKLSLTGQDISFKGSSGKTLASGISAAFNTSLRGQTLSIQKGILNYAQGPSFRIEGTVDHFASADRTGNLSFTLPSTTINSLLDVIANALPRNLQEASCEGSCMLAGSVELQGASTRINGKLSLEAASIEIPSQKITVSGIEGSIPFSLEFPWQGTGPKHPTLGYSRDNYAKILKDLTSKSGAGSRITISTARFGALETGSLSLFITASDGIMMFSPIEMNLYEGKLLGNAYLIPKGTPEYGADILVTDISLKQFCNSFPSIKGYITGRVDGILSLKNSKGELKELTGFVNLWTRTGKGEEMLVSKEFLQKLAGKKLRGFFFQNDRPYDNGEISAYLLNNYLTFEKLDISHTNFLGMKDLSVSVAPVQNRIALDHLLQSIRDAAARGKGGGEGAPPVQTDLKWLE